jgi:hypothetical protein
MMIRIKLTPEAREELERTFKTTPDRRLRERCQAVLMAHRGAGRLLRILACTGPRSTAGCAPIGPAAWRG